MRRKIKTQAVLMISIALLIGMYTGFSQSKYLKITLSDDPSYTIKLPPKTKFELTNYNDIIVYDDESAEYEYKIKGKHKLKVYPNWKSEADVFYITNGKIEVIDRPIYKDKKSGIKRKAVNKSKYSYDKDKYTKGLKMKKTLKESKLYPNRFNATFKFSNGITANYTDGKFNASLEGRKLRITEKYFIHSEFGIIKLSFRPRDGKTWWVFEPF